MKPVLKAFALLLAVGGVGALVAFFVITSRGISARTEPGSFETTVARTMRTFAVPRAERDRKNPVPLTDEAIASAKAHWADHCATCHANDGSGQTTMGQGMYPKAPDMRLEPTQSLTDGELFYIIENGIRLTGMPAWGSGNPDAGSESWELVHFIRRLAKLTPQDLEEMAEMNPRSVMQIREEEEMRRFLEGEGGDTGKRPKKRMPMHNHDKH